MERKLIKGAPVGSERSSWNQQVQIAKENKTPKRIFRAAGDQNYNERYTAAMEESRQTVTHQRAERELNSTKNSKHLKGEDASPICQNETQDKQGINPAKVDGE